MYNFYKKNKIISKNKKKFIISNEFGVSKNLIRIKNFFKDCYMIEQLLLTNLCCYFN